MSDITHIGDLTPDPPELPKLNKRQRVFVEEYLRCWNATEAALRAGYSERSAKEIGCENLTKPNIAIEVEKRINEKAMTADEVLLRLAKQARGAASDFIEVNAGLPFLNWQTLADADKLDLIKKLSYDKEGRPVVEFYDAQAALVHIGKHLKLFTDKLEHTGSGKDGAILHQDVSADELDAARKRRQEAEGDGSG